GVAIRGDDRVVVVRGGGCGNRHGPVICETGGLSHLDRLVECLGCGAMGEAAAKAFELFRADIGNDEGTGDWFEVTQDQINHFADVTHDHQFIHVDPERAAATPFGGTIAHGFLTLAMLTHLAAGASSGAPDPAKYEGILMGINY